MIAVSRAGAAQVLRAATPDVAARWPRFVVTSQMASSRSRDIDRHADFTKALVVKVRNFEMNEKPCVFDHRGERGAP